MDMMHIITMPVAARAMRASFLFLCLALLAATGCSTTGPLPILSERPGFDEQGAALVGGDPGGPIPAPQLPADMRTGSPADPAPESEGEGIPYAVEVITSDAPELEAPFRGASLLEQLKDQPPQTMTGLDQRLRSDITTATDVLHSLGYYAGEADGRLKNNEHTFPGSPATVAEISFTPGPRYTVGETVILCRYPDRDELAPPLEGLPATLSGAGLDQGSPAVAEDVLAAVNRAHQAFLNNGYPYASIASTRYTVDHGDHTLEARVVIATGQRMRMGSLRPTGEYKVRESYLRNLQTWEPGQLWDQRLAENYRDALRQTGLFQSAEVRPAGREEEDGTRRVVVRLAPLPERTVGAAVKYDTDFGPGVELRWEHRNLTGNGDRLTVEMPIWVDLQQLSAQYRLPFFLHPRQDFIANAAAINEKTDAYEMMAAIAAFGIERRFTDRFRANIMARGEAGELKDPEKNKTSYYMVGLPVELWYDTTASLLDAAKGYRLTAQLAPHTGEYQGPFSIFRTRLEGQFFQPLIDEDRLVFALRAATGVMAGATPQKVPPSVRFYSGGGGSVRGYAYQSLGPRNDKQDPLGGGSFEEINMELRYKITPQWGVVGFVDGGMAYEDTVPKYFCDTRWGAGIGIRFYTAIGPVRLDVATPLNPRDDDDAFQIYFSIGQNF